MGKRVFGRLKVSVESDLLDYGIEKEVTQIKKLLMVILKKSNTTAVIDLLQDLYNSAVHSVYKREV